MKLRTWIQRRAKATGRNETEVAIDLAHRAGVAFDTIAACKTRRRLVHRLETAEKISAATNNEVKVNELRK